MQQRRGPRRDSFGARRITLPRSRVLGGPSSRLGPLCYLSSVQYFVVQLVVALRWSPRYSWSRNPISDLGNTSCANFHGRAVCSPLHGLMNLSFGVLGLTMIAGSMVLLFALPRTRVRTLGFSFMSVAGSGVALVGLSPENVAPSMHAIGAALPFVVGNVGVVLLGWSLPLPAALRRFSVAAGVVALTALVFYATGHDLGLGEGGLERLVAYPQTVWLIVVGAWWASSPLREW